MTVQPIKPEEIVGAKRASIPDDVIAVFNGLIAKHWNGTYSRFKQKEVEALVCGRMEIEPKVLYDNHHLDVEDIYREQGWKVVYDRPGFNESYDATFEFRKN